MLHKIAFSESYVIVKQCSFRKLKTIINNLLWIKIDFDNYLSVTEIIHT